MLGALIVAGVRFSGHSEMQRLSYFLEIGDYNMGGSSPPHISNR